MHSDGATKRRSDGGFNSILRLERPFRRVVAPWLRSFTNHRVDHGLRNIHVRDGIAKLVRFRALDLNRALADDRSSVPAVACGVEFIENLFKQLALKQAKCLRRE